MRSLLTCSPGERQYFKQASKLVVETDALVSKSSLRILVDLTALSMDSTDNPPPPPLDLWISVFQDFTPVLEGL